MRLALQEFQPNIVVTGHIHEACEIGVEDISGKKVVFAAIGNEGLRLP